MNSSQRKTLSLLFAGPVPTTLAWGSIEALFRAVGAKVIEGRGSRVRFELKGVIATFHRPTLKRRLNLIRCAMRADFLNRQE